MNSFKKIIVITSVIISCIITTQAQIKYPFARKSDQVDDYFGTTVPDPYRWMEDNNSAETKQWASRENALTKQYLETIPFRDSIKKRLESMWNYERYSSPFKKGNYFYYYKNSGLQNQSVLYRQLGLTGTPEVFIDPNTMSEDGTTLPWIPVFTKSTKYCAYLLSPSGSDWQEVYIMDVQTKKLLTDTIKWIKFSDIVWRGDEGFYYSRYPRTTEQNKLTDKNLYNKLYFHKIGTSQSSDELIYENKHHPLRAFKIQVTEDERYLVVYESEGAISNHVLIKNLQKKSLFTSLIDGAHTNSSVIDTYNGRLLVLTADGGASNNELVAIDPLYPQRQDWDIIVPERKDLLESVTTAGGKLFLTYLKNAASKVYECNYDGSMQTEIKLPGIGTAKGFEGEKSDTDLFYSFSSFTYPTTIYHYSIVTNKSSVFKKPIVNINPDDYETVQVFFESKDGVIVPMFITYKKGIQLDGNNPTLIYGYGGFNHSLTPDFNISNAFFLQQGGVYVQINLRGGGEFGERWHAAGMLLNKQHVFDDVFAAVNYLIEKKLTNPQKIALRGASNGGLMVGACITQHPELFKVAIPQVGVMDMLRYHLYTIGWEWAWEYGKSDERESFKNIYSYSPLHNIKYGVTYPATLITTTDNDDRVVPSHSFKFAARMQECNEGANPVLLRIGSNVGHGLFTPTRIAIEEATDIWSFVMYNLGMQFKQ